MKTYKIVYKSTEPDAWQTGLAYENAYNIHKALSAFLSKRSGIEVLSIELD